MVKNDFFDPLETPKYPDSKSDPPEKFISYTYFVYLIRITYTGGGIGIYSALWTI